MSSQVPVRHAASSSDEPAICALHQQMLNGWNQRSSNAIAAAFAEDGQLIGFDGSQMTGSAEIAATLQQTFADHPTPAFVGKVRQVSFLAPEVALLHAIAGMVLPGKADIEAPLNAIQTLVAVKHGEQWRIALFQNTPAQFHGRPELVESLTEELRQLL